MVTEPCISRAMIRSGSSGRTMMRCPNGSWPPEGRGRRMPPKPRSSSALSSASTTLMYGNGLQGRKICGRLPCVFIRDGLGDHIHDAAGFSGAALHVIHLAQDVCRREAGERGGFRVAHSVWQMAGVARAHIALTLRDDGRHGGMLLGKPIRGIHEVVHLLPGIGLGAARHLYGGVGSSAEVGPYPSPGKPSQVPSPGLVVAGMLRIRVTRVKLASKAQNRNFIQSSRNDFRRVLQLDSIP